MACITLCAHSSHTQELAACKGQFPLNLWQECHEDVQDEETLKAVEVAVRESTSVKKIIVNCQHLNWTNVATALLKGATENKSLRELTLQMAWDFPPPQNVLAEVKRKRKSLLLRVNNEEW